MFGADYPLFTYERLVDDWQALGYDEEVLEQGDAPATPTRLFAARAQGAA